MRLMDSIFRGITEFLDKNINIKLKTKYTGTARDNKNFAIRVLENGTGGNRLVIQSLNDETVKAWLGQIDWDTGNLKYNYFIETGGASLKVVSLPPAIKGGLVYLDSVGWYKCEDGVNWVKVNI